MKVDPHSLHKNLCFFKKLKIALMKFEFFTNTINGKIFFVSCQLFNIKDTICNIGEYNL